MIDQQWPKVFIVLLHWKNYENTSMCLKSLKQITYPNYQVIVVDNHSADGSIERLQVEFPNCIFLLNAENLGFSRGCNVGIRKAYDLGASYVLLLNNDMQVELGFLEPAVQTGEQNPAVGLITGKIMYLDRPNVFWQAGGYIHPLRIQGIPRGFGEVDRGQFDEVCETGWASGAMLLIRRSVLETIGFLPEEYFFGQEEWDFSTAVLRAGLKILYVPIFKAYHIAGGSYQAGHPVLIVYNGMRNKMIYAQKYMPALAFQIWRWVFWLYLLVAWPRRAREGTQTEGDYQARLKAAHLAFKDHKGLRRVELADLENAARIIGPTPTWGAGWRPLSKVGEE